MNKEAPLVAARAALYLRVSTARQAEHDVSIPDQRKQGEAYCQARGHQLVETFAEHWQGRLTGVRQAQGTCEAVKQGQPEQVFERLDLVAHRRWRDVQLARSLGEAQMPGCCFEGSKSV